VSREWSIRAYGPADREALLAFFSEVFGSMGREFLPHGKDADVDSIETAYTANRGSFHVVDVGGKLQGSVGVRNLSADVAELKRLYLTEHLRGRGVGHALCVQAIRDASALGYRFLRLDTTPHSAAAIRLFTKLGFYQIPRYNEDPFAEIFMEKVLTSPLDQPAPPADGS
jgi:ribosomal protein S18 acetylase RimI-like enzyme